MNKDLFLDAVSYLDMDLLKKHLKKKERLRFNPTRKNRTKIIKWSAAVVACVCVLCGTNLLIQYVPVRYELDYYYGGSDGEDEHVLDKNVWIYYVDQTSIRKERVVLPCNAENIFITWKHLNHIGNDVQLLTYEIMSNHQINSTDYNGEGVHNNILGDHFVLNITVSSEIKAYANYDSLMSSLEKTMTGYLNVEIDVINIYFK